MAIPLPSLAIVVPVFNEEPVLSELLSRLGGVCDRLPDYDWRLIFVDDGSRDRSAEILRAHAQHVHGWPSSSSREISGTKRHSPPDSRRPPAAPPRSRSMPICRIRRS